MTIEIKIGDRFTRLVATSEIYTSNHKYGRNFKYVDTVCDCGTYLTVLLSSIIRKGYLTKSCGCLHKELSSQRAKVCPMAKTHGATRPRTYAYTSWESMKARCVNYNHRSWKYYGGKGIKVCSQWKDSFDTFLKDMGNRDVTECLDRIDPTGNYEPGNCRWVSKVKNARLSNKGRKKLCQLP